MKYLSASLILFSLSFISALLSLYYGNLTSDLDKEISNIKSEIYLYKEKIKINELEYAIHTKTDYLIDLQELYLDRNVISTSKIKFINFDDIKKDNKKNFLKVSIK